MTRRPDWVCVGAYALGVIFSALVYYAVCDAAKHWIGGR